MNSLVFPVAVALAGLVACGDNTPGGSVDGSLDSGGSGSGSIDAPLAATCAPPPAGAAAERVPTTSGVVHGAGFTGSGGAGSGFAYLDVPFAAPPVGDLRFAAPTAPACPTADVEATTLGPECAQLDGSGDVAGVEDCLQLNVWAPAAPAAPRPVMVWIHGGGNVQGSATDPLFDGQALALAGDVLVVTVNYRLAQLGFIALPSLAAEAPGSGNFGLLDQIAGLQWVHDNIAAFGGDPTNVTIFGESAGGRDVCSLVASPKAAGLFVRSIMESGSCSGLPTKSAAEAVGTAWASDAGCGSADAACVRALPLATVLQTDGTTASILVSTPYQPAIDGIVQPVEPLAAIAAGTHNHGAFVVGANADETAKQVGAIADDTAYAAALTQQFGATLEPKIIAQYPSASYATPRAAFVQATTDARFVCPARQIARTVLAGQTEPTYRYFFAYAPTAIGAFHGIELPYVFGTFSATALTPSATDLAVSAAVQTDWLSFAHTGVPAGSPTWPSYASNDPVREYDATPSVVDGIRTANCDFWASLEVGQ